MNNSRRKEIEKILLVVSSIKRDIELVRDDEEENLGNIPENLQESSMHCCGESYVEKLDTAYDSIDEVEDVLTDLVNEF